MPEETKLINVNVVSLDGLSEPGKMLVEKVSDAIGGIAKPWQMKRVAKAEVEVAKIQAKGQLDITEFQQRALIRMVREEEQKQHNIENITFKAIPYLKTDAKPENIERDWLTNFFDKCRLISDEEMQVLWAKILADEANNPGTFSKRTIEFVSRLDKSDAQLFTKFCSYIWTFANGTTSLIFDADKEIYTAAGFDFMTLNHLEDIGLIKFNNLVGYISRNISGTIEALYYGKRVVIEMPGSITEFNIGKVVLTRIGDELVGIAGGTPSDDYFNYVINKWQSFGYKVILSEASASCKTYA